MSYKKAKNPYYSATFKRSVVSRIESGEMSVLEAARHYGIGGSMTLYRWLAEHKNATEMSKQSSEVKKSAVELAAEVASLKKLLEQERIRSEAYLTMIKLAEEQFQIPIEKKPGAKQSK